MLKSKEHIKNLITLMTSHIEVTLILTGLFALLIAVFVPIRIDIRFLWAEFGSFLVVAGIIAKSIPAKNS